MKNKLAAKGAAIAVAAMMAAGLGTGSVREAMASTQIPAKGVADTVTVSDNKLKISPTVTVSPSPETKKVPGNQVLTPKTEKTEESQPSEAPKGAEASETPAAEETPSVKSEKKTEEKTADAKTVEEKDKDEISDKKASSSIPKPKEEADQEPVQEKPLSSLRRDKKTAVNITDSVFTEAESGTTEESQTTHRSESKLESASESAPETFKAEDTEAPAEETKEPSGNEDVSASSETSVNDKTSESEEENADQAENSDGKNSAEEAVQQAGGEESDTVNGEPTAAPADIAENAPIPKPSKEPEEETVLVGAAGQTQTVGASSGATQIVGDTTKRYETNVARAVITATPQRNTAVSNKGDLLAPKASGQSASLGNHTTLSSKSETGQKSSGSSAQNGTNVGSSKNRIRTSTPQTGDHSGAILYAMMAGASLAAAAAAILALKRER